MDKLRSGLGHHKPASDALHEHWLTLHELAELIRRAGRDLGFIVRSECPTSCADDKRGKIDWVWLSAVAQKPIVAFEIEGRDAKANSLRNDLAKFRACGAAINVIALFQVDHDHTPKGLPPMNLSPHDWVRQHIGEFPVEVVLDQELMAAGGIERLQNRARELSK